MRPFITAGFPVPRDLGADEFDTQAAFDAAVDAAYPPQKTPPQVDPDKFAVVDHMGVKWVAIPAPDGPLPLYPILPMAGGHLEAKRKAIAAIKTLL